MNLRSGSIATAVYTLIMSAIQIGFSGYLFIVAAFIQALFVWFVINLVMFAALFLVSILLIIGIRKDVPGLYMPWILLILVVTLLQLIMNIVLLVIIQLTVFTLACLAVWLVCACVNIYGFLCVLSQYQKVIAGKATESSVQERKSRIRSKHRSQTESFTSQQQVYSGKSDMDTNYSQV